jgi:hypothetical protein
MPSVTFSEPVKPLQPPDIEAGMFVLRTSLPSAGGDCGLILPPTHDSCSNTATCRSDASPAVADAGEVLRQTSRQIRGSCLLLREIVQARCATDAALDDHTVRRLKSHAHDESDHHRRVFEPTWRPVVITRGRNSIDADWDVVSPG